MKHSWRYRYYVKLEKTVSVIDDLVFRGRRGMDQVPEEYYTFGEQILLHIVLILLLLGLLPATLYWKLKALDLPERLTVRAGTI